LFKNKNSIKFFALTLLTSLLLLAALNSNVISVKAQGQATVNILDSVGGTTDPAAGTITPADGTPVTLTATANDNFVFQYWIISTSEGATIVYDNPASLDVSGGVTYDVQAIFQPIQLPPRGIPVTNSATAAIVVVLAAAGGTTTPAPGTYQLENATELKLTAMPDNGWQFSHWVISGISLSHGAYPFTPVPTDNPYTVGHGYGYTYNYQPVFTPTGITEPTPAATATAAPAGTIGGLSTDTAIIIGLVAVIIIILIAFGIFAMRKNKK
jgi:Divergent InlB B-repeat domain